MFYFFTHGEYLTIFFDWIDELGPLGWVVVVLLLVVTQVFILLFYYYYHYSLLINYSNISSLFTHSPPSPTLLSSPFPSFPPFPFLPSSLPPFLPSSLPPFLLSSFFPLPLPSPSPPFPFSPSPLFPLPPSFSPISYLLPMGMLLLLWLVGLFMIDCGLDFYWLLLVLLLGCLLRFI